MTTSDVSLALFERVRGHFDDDQIVELTELIAWENASARFESRAAHRLTTSVARIAARSRRRSVTGVRTTGDATT